MKLRRQDMPDPNAIPPEGTFHFKTGPDGTRYISMGMPMPVECCTLPLTGPKAWSWDGNEHEPTLSPSIKIGTDQAVLWHGHLVRGELQNCADSPNRF